MMPLTSAERPVKVWKGQASSEEVTAGILTLPEVLQSKVEALLGLSTSNKSLNHVP